MKLNMHIMRLRTGQRGLESHDMSVMTVHPGKVSHRKTEMTGQLQ
jgi:hypothetical protein